MMQDAITKFHTQFSYAPVIEYKEHFKRRKKFIVLGMGGSHLAADVLLSYDPTLDITIHSDYGLPSVNEKDLHKTLVIASSYSGNTEEVVNGLNDALDKGLDVAVVATGGTLIDTAKAKRLPYVQLPDTGIQPRSALGFGIVALLKIMGLREGLREARALKKLLRPKALEPQGKELAGKLKNYVPVIYSSTRNRAVGYNWKIKFNETGKIPAFYNVIPELNHNEMTGFSAQGGTAMSGDIADIRKLMEMFYFIFIKDNSDNERVNKRMYILKKLYQDRGLNVEVIEMAGESRFAKIFTSLIVADWAAVYTAEQYGLESEQVPMVEEFKKLMAN